MVAVSSAVIGIRGPPSSSTMIMPAIGPPIHHVEDRGDVDLALSQRAVAQECLAAAVVLHVHVIDDRQKIFHHLHRIGAALLKLPDIRPELDVPRVDRFHDSVGLVARLDAGAGVLVQASGESNVGQAPCRIR